MKVFYVILMILLILPLSAVGEEKIPLVRSTGEQYLSDVEANEYKKFLNEMRKTDTKRVFIDYKEDRDTRYRKLRESADFEAREASILNQRLWDQRIAERWDKETKLIEKYIESPHLMYRQPAGRRTRY